jgi:hypothetical protein
MKGDPAGREKTSNIQHPPSNIEHPTSNIQHPTSNIQHPLVRIELYQPCWTVVGRGQGEGQVTLEMTSPQATEKLVRSAFNLKVQGACLTFFYATMGLRNSPKFLNGNPTPTGELGFMNRLWCWRDTSPFPFAFWFTPL